MIYHHAPFHEAQSLSQNENTAKARASFYLSPDPLPPALPYLRTSTKSPAPRAWEERAVRQICGCGPVYDLPLSPCPVPSHSLSLVRLLEIDLQAYPCRSVLLIAHPIRRAGRSMAGVLGIPSAAFSASSGLAVLRPSLRSSDTRDGAMMSPAYQSAGGIDGRRRRSISGGLLFRYDSVLVRLRRSAPLFAYPIRETGRGLFVGPRSVVRLLVAVIDCIADGDGVPIDGS